LKGRHGAPRGVPRLSPTKELVRRAGRRVIRQRRNPPKLQYFGAGMIAHDLRVHPQAEPVFFCVGG